MSGNSPACGPLPTRRGGWLAACCIQTPYFWFPIDPHWPTLPMFHWMTLSWRQKLLRRHGLGWGGPCRDIDHAMRDMEGTTLLDWSQMQTPFPDRRIRAERFLGLAKSMIAERRSR